MSNIIKELSYSQVEYATKALELLDGIQSLGDAFRHGPVPCFYSNDLHFGTDLPFMKIHQIIVQKDGEYTLVPGIEIHTNRGDHVAMTIEEWKKATQ